MRKPTPEEIRKEIIKINKEDNDWIITDLEVDDKKVELNIENP